MASLVASLILQGPERRKPGEARFDETVIIIEEAIDQRMDAYVDAMLDSRGLFYASSSIGKASGGITWLVAI